MVWDWTTNLFSLMSMYFNFLLSVSIGEGFNLGALILFAFFIITFIYFLKRAGD